MICDTNQYNAIREEIDRLREIVASDVYLLDTSNHLTEPQQQVLRSLRDIDIFLRLADDEVQRLWGLI